MSMRHSSLLRLCAEANHKPLGSDLYSFVQMLRSFAPKTGTGWCKIWVAPKEAGCPPWSKRGQWGHASAGQNCHQLQLHPMASSRDLSKATFTHTALYSLCNICIYIYIDIILYNMSWYDAITFCRHIHEQVRTHSLLMRNCRFDSVVFRQEVEGWKIHGDGSLFLLAWFVTRLPASHLQLSEGFTACPDDFASAPTWRCQKKGQVMRGRWLQWKVGLAPRAFSKICSWELRAWQSLCLACF